jgi:hypothetical protein
MPNYHNDVYMQEQHRHDLLNEVHMDRLARQARGDGKNALVQLVTNPVGRLSCLMLGWGKGIMQASDGSRQASDTLAAALVKGGLVLNRLAYSEAQGCNCCV